MDIIKRRTRDGNVVVYKTTAVYICLMLSIIVALLIRGLCV